MLFRMGRNCAIRSGIGYVLPAAFCINPVAISSHTLFSKPCIVIRSPSKKVRKNSRSAWFLFKSAVLMTTSNLLFVVRQGQRS